MSVLFNDTELNKYIHVLNGFTSRAVSYTHLDVYKRQPDDWEGESWCDRAKCAVCEMTEILYADEKRSGKTSENTDGYSVSYDTEKSLSSTFYDVVQVYLSDTGLLYAGVCPC